MSDDCDRPLPVLVLGLGNLLLRDDAAGLRLLDELRQLHGDDRRIEFVDGGTQGIALTALFGGRAAVLLLDAVQVGAPAGTVHRVLDPLQRPPRGNAGAKGGAHQMNAGDLLLTASLLGELPRCLAVVGIEPAVVRTGIGLSPEVEAAIPAAAEAASSVLRELLGAEVLACTN